MERHFPRQTTLSISLATRTTATSALYTASTSSKDAHSTCCSALPPSILLLNDSMAVQLGPFTRVEQSAASSAPVRMKPLRTRHSYPVADSSRSLGSRTLRFDPCLSESQLPRLKHQLPSPLDHLSLSLILLGTLISFAIGHSSLVSHRPPPPYRHWTHPSPPPFHLASLV